MIQVIAHPRLTSHHRDKARSINAKAFASEGIPTARPRVSDKEGQPAPLDLADKTRSKMGVR